MSRAYKNELANERKALQELLRQREELATKIAKQQTRVAALAALCEQSEEVGEMTELDLGGLTNACRTAFRAAGNRGFSPRTHKQGKTVRAYASQRLPAVNPVPFFQGG